MNPRFWQYFWQRHPALLYGLSFLVGTSSFLFWEAPWNWLFPLLWSLYLLSIRIRAPLFLLLGGIFYAWCLYGSPPSCMEGRGYFSLCSLQPHQTPFYKGLLYRGFLVFSGKKVPCSIYYRGEKHPPAVCDYLVSGKLEQRREYEYTFKVKEWIPVEKSWSLAELRYQMKEKLRHFLDRKLTKPRTASFLSSLISGDVEDRSLKFDFGRLGLQHILAISGFHFAILIAFCSFFAGLFLSPKGRLIFLWIAINLYFLFVGALPAVQRSWLTAQFYLIGKLFRWNTTGLNLLGVALLAELIFNPLAGGQIGFQLSFLSCAGILFLHPFLERKLRFFFPKRTSLEFTSLSFLSQHGALLSAFLRNGMSIALSVNLALLPLLLYHFHQFPLLSFIYNLFFPFLVGGALFFLLVSLIAHLLFPPLSTPLFYLTDSITSATLALASHPPLALDFSVQVSSIPPWTLPFYLFFLFSSSLFLQKFDEFPSIR